GPSAWRVGLLAALEVGIAAGIAAWAANTMILRRPARAEAGAGRRAKGKKRPAKRPRTRETPVPVARWAPVPGDCGRLRAPAPTPRVAPGRRGSEEPDPLLRPGSPRRRPAPLPDIEPDTEPDTEPASEEGPPAREPAPQSGGTVVV